jgi:hypothetical protein
VRRITGTTMRAKGVMLTLRSSGPASLQPFPLRLLELEESAVAVADVEAKERPSRRSASRVPAGFMIEFGLKKLLMLRCEALLGQKSPFTELKHDRESTEGKWKRSKVEDVVSFPVPTKILNLNELTYVCMYLASYS